MNDHRQDDDQSRAPKPRSPERRERDIALPSDEEPASSHFGARLRGYFLTGLIVVGPVAITIYVVWWFINLVDAWVKPLMPQALSARDTIFPSTCPGVGLIVGIVGLMVVGALTANLFGRTLVSYGEMMLDRMPIVRSVYRPDQADLRRRCFSKNGGSFKRVGLIEFPRRGLYCDRVPRRRSAAGGRGEDRRRQSADHRVHAERPEPDHRLHRLRAGERGDPARSLRRGRGEARGVGGSGRRPTSRMRCASSPSARAPSRCPRKSRSFDGCRPPSHPARISLIASSRSNR